MKKLILTLKIRLGGILLSILQNKIGYILFNIIYFIYNIPFSILFIFLWTYNVISNFNYIKNHYSKEDLGEFKKIGIDYIEQFRKYAIHINIITWIIILLINIK